MNRSGTTEQALKPRKELNWWNSFNTWWRDEYDKLGRRPKILEVDEWYRENAALVWGPDKPSLEETRSHAKGLRSVEDQRQYFQRYKASKMKGPKDQAGLGSGQRANLSPASSSDMGARRSSSGGGTAAETHGNGVAHSVEGGGGGSERETAWQKAHTSSGTHSTRQQHEQQQHHQQQQHHHQQQHQQQISHDNGVAAGSGSGSGGRGAVARPLDLSLPAAETDVFTARHGGGSSLSAGGHGRTLAGRSHSHSAATTEGSNGAGMIGVVNTAAGTAAPAVGSAQPSHDGDTRQAIVIDPFLPDNKTIKAHDNSTASFVGGALGGGVAPSADAAAHAAAAAGSKGAVRANGSSGVEQVHSTLGAVHRTGGGGSGAVQLKQILEELASSVLTQQRSGGSSGSDGAMAGEVAGPGAAGGHLSAESFLRIIGIARQILGQAVETAPNPAALLQRLVELRAGGEVQEDHEQRGRATEEAVKGAGQQPNSASASGGSGGRTHTYGTAAVTGSGDVHGGKAFDGRGSGSVGATAATASPTPRASDPSSDVMQRFRQRLLPLQSAPGPTGIMLAGPGTLASRELSLASLARMGSNGVAVSHPRRRSDSRNEGEELAGSGSVSNEVEGITTNGHGNGSNGNEQLAGGKRTSGTAFGLLPTVVGAAGGPGEEPETPSFNRAPPPKHPRLEQLRRGSDGVVRWPADPGSHGGEGQQVYPSHPTHQQAVAAAAKAAAHAALRGYGPVGSSPPDPFRIQHSRSGMPSAFGSGAPLQAATGNTGPPPPLQPRDSEPLPLRESVGTWSMLPPPPPTRDPLLPDARSLPPPLALRESVGTAPVPLLTGRDSIETRLMPPPAAYLVERLSVVRSSCSTPPSQYPPQHHQHQHPQGGRPAQSSPQLQPNHHHHQHQHHHGGQPPASPLAAAAAAAGAGEPDNADASGLYAIAEAAALMASAEGEEAAAGREQEDASPPAGNEPNHQSSGGRLRPEQHASLRSGAPVLLPEGGSGQAMNRTCHGVVSGPVVAGGPGAVGRGVRHVVVHGPRGGVDLVRTAAGGGPGAGGLPGAVMPAATALAAAAPAPGAGAAGPLAIVYNILKREVVEQRVGGREVSSPVQMYTVHLKVPAAAAEVLRASALRAAGGSGSAGGGGGSARGPVSQPQ